MKIKKILVKNLCLDYRDDIILMYYTLTTNKKELYRHFSKLKANKKLNHRKLGKIYRSIKKRGQKIHIQAVKFKGHFYPANGAHRIAALLTIGLNSEIKIKQWKRIQCHKWNERRTLTTHHFKGLKKKLMDDFLEFRTQYYQKINRPDLGY